jgi:flagellar motor switch protein FliG
MHQVSREQVHQILHDFKKECYLLEHRSGLHDQVEQEVQRTVRELLSLSHRYEFHRQPTKERAEIFNMIENYTREAVLPPILNRLVERMVVLEGRQAAGVRCIERLIHVIERTDARVSQER